MKALIFAVVSAATIQAQAVSLSCEGTRIFGREATVQLEAEATGDAEISTLRMEIDTGSNQISVRTGKMEGRDFSGRKFKNQVRFEIPDRSIRGSLSGFSLSLLLPDGWGEKGRFKATLIDQAADGGSYNRLNCSTAD